VPPLKGGLLVLSTQGLDRQPEGFCQMLLSSLRELQRVRVLVPEADISTRLVVYECEDVAHTSVRAVRVERRFGRPFRKAAVSVHIKHSSLPLPSWLPRPPS